MLSTRTHAAANAVRSASWSRAVAVRSFAFSTSRRNGLKESSSQTSEDYEKHKQDSLAKQKRGEGHWKRELASDGEEAVKADREAAKGGHSEADMKKLQERTKAAAEDTAKSGTSMHDGM